jgi:hypothetical protein
LGIALTPAKKAKQKNGSGGKAPNPGGTEKIKERMDYVIK